MRRVDLINWREVVIGTMTFLLIAAIWYAPVTARHGWEFIHEFFIRHHFQRFTSNEFGHPQPFYFFLLIAIAGIAPWSAFLLPAIVHFKRLQPRRDRRDAFVAFAWVWAVVVILFFSFSGSKLPGYILPAFPALAIIVGDQLERFVAGSREGLMQAAAWTILLLIALIATGFAVYLHREGIAADGWRVIYYILPVVMVLAAMATLIAKKRSAFIAGATGVMVSVIACAVIVLAPKLSDELTLKQLSLEAAAALRPGERIAFFIRKEYALADALRGEPSFVVITTENWRGGLERDTRFTTQLLARQRDALALRVSLK
jgi:4-amino-4-deoxy-L-arabinose transferase-like glycosyltransferase